MKRDTKLYLEDIIENIERIEKSIVKLPTAASCGAS